MVVKSIFGPSKVDEGVKLNSANYCDFMDKTFFLHGTSPNCSFNLKSVLMHDNAPFHVSKFAFDFFEHKRFTGEKIID